MSPQVKAVFWKAYIFCLFKYMIMSYCWVMFPLGQKEKIRVAYFETPFVQQSHQVIHCSVVVDHRNLYWSEELKQGKGGGNHSGLRGQGNVI